MRSAFHWTVVLAFLFLAALAGVRAGGLFAASMAMPEFTDPARANELFTQPERLNDADRDRQSRDYFALMTDKWPLQHEAEGWAAFSASLAVLAIAAGLVAALGGDLLATPRRSWPVRALLALAFLAQIPFAVWYYSRTVDVEHCCLSSGDSTGIPIMSLSVAALVLLLGSAVYFLPLVNDRRLPATVARPLSNMKPSLILWLLYLVPPAAGFTITMLAGLEELALLVPLGIIGLWTTLVAMAAALSPYQGTQP